MVGIAAITVLVSDISEKCIHVTIGDRCDVFLHGTEEDLYVFANKILEQLAECGLKTPCVPSGKTG